MENHEEVVPRAAHLDRGFTLVELLIVIVILGILATVTVFAVRGITDRGKDSACKADRQTLEVAVEAYFAQNGTTHVPTQADLTPGFIKRASVNYDIDKNGDVKAIAGNKNGCTDAI